jgi:hypothetical protein
MSRTNIRVDIPVKKPDAFVTLAENIMAKHTELGDQSPLVNLDMTTFSTQLTNGRSRRDEAKSLRAQSEAKQQESNSALGLAKGQTNMTPGTVYSIITQIRDLLLVLNKGSEESLNEWGFKVVIS